MSAETPTMQISYARQPAPTGSARWVVFIPMSLATLALAALLAAGLYTLFGAGFYFVILTPLITALLLLGMIVLSVKIGHCRSRIVAALLGASAAAVMFVGQ